MRGIFFKSFVFGGIFGIEYRWVLVFPFFYFFIFYRWPPSGLSIIFSFVDTVVLVGGASNGGIWNIPCINEIGLIGYGVLHVTARVCHTVHDVSLGDNE